MVSSCATKLCGTHYTAQPPAPCALHVHQSMLLKLPDEDSAALSLLPQVTSYVAGSSTSASSPRPPRLPRKGLPAPKSAIFSARVTALRRSWNAKMHRGNQKGLLSTDSLWCNLFDSPAAAPDFDGNAGLMCKRGIEGIDFGDGNVWEFVYVWGAHADTANLPISWS